MYKKDETEAERIAREEREAKAGKRPGTKDGEVVEPTEPGTVTPV